jgi:hypothetical protein
MEGMMHEIWREPEGNTACLFAGERGDGARILLEKGSLLVHTFYANSHYEAMTIYYEYMGWNLLFVSIAEI